ncbi:unnamed protein product [Owenia fusiformis]|uniref:DNA repair protein SWI5 homolog n=1 Tax=Owenia fusiformis TaxID=6347 RepID=A0A8S4NW56_OWEFU|nr:unnamed protein product [Owenia fusiformis]
MTVKMDKNCNQSIVKVDETSSKLESEIESEIFSTPKLNKVIKSTSKRISSYKKLTDTFKSPVVKQTNEKRTGQTADSLQSEIDELLRKENELDTEINLLEQQDLHEDELANHITMLHKYNEMKDIGQMLLGRIGSALTCQVRIPCAGIVGSHGS